MFIAAKADTLRLQTYLNDIYMNCQSYLILINNSGLKKNVYWILYHCKPKQLIL